jgi:4-hydroxy-4-methyl-2-oxoglutarate aldolase
VIAPRVVRGIRRPAIAAIEALSAFDVATVYEAYGQRNLMEPAIRPIADGLAVCGPAITSLNARGDNLMVHAAIDVCRPGDVLVVSTTKPSLHGMVGELVATQARARGVAGIILDAGVRDVAELRGMGFPAWARAISALGTRKGAPGWVNVPVVCGSVTVNPGDVVLAGDDGVVVVAIDDLEAVVADAASRTAREIDLRRRYAGGESSLDVHGLRAVLERLGVEYDAGQADEGTSAPPSDAADRSSTS